VNMEKFISSKIGIRKHRYRFLFRIPISRTEQQQRDDVSGKKKPLMNRAAYPYTALTRYRVIFLYSILSCRISYIMRHTINTENGV
jgi:hypothetical protein